MQHLIETLEHDLKRAVRKQMSANLNDVLVSLFSLIYIYIFYLIPAKLREFKETKTVSISAC